MNYEEYFKNSISSTHCPWVENSYLKIERIGQSSIRLVANAEGLISLSRHLALLATSAESSIIYHPWPGDLELGSLDMELCRIICEGQKNIKE